MIQLVALNKTKKNIFSENLTGENKSLQLAEFVKDVIMYIFSRRIKSSCNSL